MAEFREIASAPIAANATTSSAFRVPPELTHFALMVPDAIAITATCSVSVQVSDDEDGTYYTVSYSADPSADTSGATAYAWASGITAPGKMVICEALQFAPKWAKLVTGNTVTAATSIRVFGRRFD